MYSSASESAGRRSSWERRAGAGAALELDAAVARAELDAAATSCSRRRRAMRHERGMAFGGTIGGCGFAGTGIGFPGAFADLCCTYAEGGGFPLLCFPIPMKILSRWRCRASLPES